MDFTGFGDNDEICIELSVCFYLCQKIYCFKWYDWWAAKTWGLTFGDIGDGYDLIDNFDGWRVQIIIFYDVWCFSSSVIPIWMDRLFIDIIFCSRVGGCGWNMACLFFFHCHPSRYSVVVGFSDPRRWLVFYFWHHQRGFVFFLLNPQSCGHVEFEDVLLCCCWSIFLLQHVVEYSFKILQFFVVALL